VRGTLLHSSSPGGDFYNDFVPHDAYARAGGPPYDFRLPGDATLVKVSVQRGCEYESVSGKPDDIESLIPAGQWDVLWLTVNYGGANFESVAWRFADGLGSGSLLDCARS
jgi:hypothetical protein